MDQTRRAELEARLRELDERGVDVAGLRTMKRMSHAQRLRALETFVASLRKLQEAFARAR